MTDAERDTFIAWCDAGVAAAEAASAQWLALKDPPQAEHSRIESIALRMVALKLRAEQIIASSVDPARHEASIHQQELPMTKLYKGKPVGSMRDANKNDPGFDAAKDQVVIKVDGKDETVLRTEVTEG